MKRSALFNIVSLLAILVVTALYMRPSAANSPARDAENSSGATFNVDFGVWRPALSKQVGPAAAGQEGDFWNTVGVAFNNEHTESDLRFANGEPSPIKVEMINLGGGWGNEGRMGVKDPMLDSYDYPVNNQGGNSQVILHSVPAGRYDLYLYGHGVEPKYYGDYQVKVGSKDYGRKATSDQPDAPLAKKWTEGKQYVRFNGVEVGAADKLEILIRPNQGRFQDAMICGLQLLPSGP